MSILTKMNLIHLLFIAFLTIPLVEIYLLLQVGEIIGLWPTIFMVVFTAFLGINLLRAQGISTWQRANAQLAQGQLPAMAMMEGMVLMVAGALLLTPGFFTDTLGFLALVPPLRRAVLGRILRTSRVTATFGVFSQQTGTQSPHQQTPSASASASAKDRQHPGIIEGEFTREDDD